MAIQRTVNFSDGTSASYWKVISIDLDVLGKGGRLQLAGYIDKASRDAGLLPLRTEVITISSDEYQKLFRAIMLDPEGRNPVKAAYNHAKQLTTQESAIDPVTGEETTVDVRPWADALDV